MSNTVMRDEKSQERKLKNKIKIRRVIIFFITVAMTFSVIATGMFLINRQVIPLADQLVEVAVYDAKTALIDSAQETVGSIAQGVATQVASFLYERDQDILLLAQLMPSNESYRVFSESRNSNMMPLYDEITFVDLYGQELFKYVSEGGTKTNFPMNSNMVDITISENTFAGMENYWNDLLYLEPGEIFVSDVIGVQTTAGNRFEGIIRWATPVLDFDDEIAGFVTMALNHDHIIRIVEEAVASSEYSSSIENANIFVIASPITIIAHPMHQYILTTVTYELSNEVMHEVSAIRPIQYSTKYENYDFGIVIVITNTDDFILPAFHIEEHLNLLIEEAFDENQSLFEVAGVGLMVLSIILGVIMAMLVPGKHIKALTSYPDGTKKEEQPVTTKKEQLVVAKGEQPVSTKGEQPVATQNRVQQQERQEPLSSSQIQEHIIQTNPLPPQALIQQHLKQEQLRQEQQQSAQHSVPQQQIGQPQPAQHSAPHQQVGQPQPAPQSQTIQQPQQPVKNPVQDNGYDIDQIINEHKTNKDG